MPGNPSAVQTLTLNTDFYNLLVVGNDELNRQYCLALFERTEQ